MKRGLKKAVIAGMSAALVLTSLAGCSKKEALNTEAAAVTVNGDTISAGLVNFDVHYHQSEWEAMYQMFGLVNPLNQDLTGSGKTEGENLKQMTVDSLVNMVLAEQKMEEYGVTLSEEESSKIAAAAAEFMSENNEETLEKMGATQEIVERFLELSAIQKKVENEMSADVDTEVSDEEAAQRKVQYVQFVPSTEEETEDASEEDTEQAEETEETEETTEQAAETETETETEEAAEAQESETAVLEENETTMKKSADTEEETESSTEAESETETETEDPEMAAAREAAREKAAAMIEKVKGGMDFDEAAGEVQKDLTSTTTTFGAESMTVPEELITATEGLEDGTLVETPVETDTGYYVVKVLSKLDREATDQEKENIVEQRKRDRIGELYTQWKEESEVSQDDKVLEGIVFDFSLVIETEAVTEAESETSAETEAVTEAQSETSAETEAVTEAQSETSAETETETSAETETEAVTEEAAETETETETETEAVTE